MAHRRSHKSMNMNKNNKCCSHYGAPLIIGHLLLLLGTYLLSWGLTGLGFWGVLKSPVFWGIFLILAGFCNFAAARMAHMHEMCNCK